MLQALVNHVLEIDMQGNKMARRFHLWSVNSEFMHLTDFLVPEHLDGEDGTRPLKTISSLIEEHSQIKHQ